MLKEVERKLTASGSSLRVLGRLFWHGDGVASYTAGENRGNCGRGGCENNELQVRRDWESRRGTVFYWERGRARCNGLFVRMFGPFVWPRFPPFHAVSPQELIFTSFAIDWASRLHLRPSTGSRAAEF